MRMLSLVLFMVSMVMACTPAKVPVIDAPDAPVSAPADASADAPAPAPTPTPTDAPDAPAPVADAPADAAK